MLLLFDETFRLRTGVGGPGQSETFLRRQRRVHGQLGPQPVGQIELLLEVRILHRVVTIGVS